MWLPVALTVQDEIESVWEFITDDSVSEFSRDAVVQGLIAMAVLSPETRPRVIRFIEKMLDNRNGFDEQRRGGLLCDCGDHNLHELRRRVIAFAETMVEGIGYSLLICTPNDLKRSFTGKTDKWTESNLKESIYSLNLWSTDSLVH
jgi:hypothetical protein